MEHAVELSAEFGLRPLDRLAQAIGLADVHGLIPHLAALPLELAQGRDLLRHGRGPAAVIRPGVAGR